MDKRPWWHGAKGEWYVVIQVLLFALVVFGPRHLAGIPQWPAGLGTIMLALGLGLIIIGGSLAFLGLLILGRNLSALPHPLDDAQFVERGPYRWVRHPIYSGIILAAFGWALFVQGTLTLLYALILFLFFDLKTRREERFLEKKFPEYAGYKQRVRKLIPYLY